MTLWLLSLIARALATHLRLEQPSPSEHGASQPPCRREHVMAAVVVVTDETTRADLAETLGHLNDAAIEMRRRGYIGTRSAAYTLQHERINAVLTDLLAAPA